jgi:hypothetical protein
MKTRSKVVLALAMLIAFAGGPANAGTPSASTATPNIDRREARQEWRIRQGVRSGRLTRGETRRLQRGERHIRRMELRAKANGRVTPRERRHMERALNRESRRIHRLKHNGRMRRA